MEIENQILLENVHVLTFEDLVEFLDISFELNVSCLFQSQNIVTPMSLHFLQIINTLSFILKNQCILLNFNLLQSLVLIFSSNSTLDDFLMPSPLSKLFKRLRLIFASDINRILKRYILDLLNLCSEDLSYRFLSTLVCLLFSYKSSFDHLDVCFAIEQNDLNDLTDAINSFVSSELIIARNDGTVWSLEIKPDLIQLLFNESFSL